MEYNFAVFYVRLCVRQTEGERKILCVCVCVCVRANVWAIV